MDIERWAGDRIAGGRGPRRQSAALAEDRRVVGSEFSEKRLQVVKSRGLGQFFEKVIRRDAISQAFLDDRVRVFNEFASGR